MYTITVSFAGTLSYGPSYATTTIGVSEAPSPAFVTPTPPAPGQTATPTPPVTEAPTVAPKSAPTTGNLPMSTFYAIAAIIIAILSAAQ